MLLVDDEAIVRHATALQLRDLGYEVIEADSAAAALQLVERGLVPDVLVTDHVMAEMGLPLRPIETLVIAPSERLDDIAARHVDALPFGIRTLLGGIGWRADTPGSAFQLALEVLRQLDAAGAREIWVEAPPRDAAWDGVRDRLSRAAAAFTD